MCESLLKPAMLTEVPWSWYLEAENEVETSPCIARPPKFQAEIFAFNLAQRSAQGRFQLGAVPAHLLLAKFSFRVDKHREEVGT